ncbi:hypothetical protein K1719_007149 [Acacia pycnantha]|nr:hypothetical protein K1719_007149 [Acacia pycnantha]
MIQNYQDAMAICAWAGYPDIFITFTCNPMWPKITRHCDQDGLKPCDRPEILSRIFNLKLHKLMRTLKDQKIFGSIKADVYTVEFQKRGLPHAHIILWLSESDKIRSLFEVDQLISAEIPDKLEDPELYELVGSYMVHGPCGRSSRSALYERWRDDGHMVSRKGVKLDNRSVVPYNATLLKLFGGHLNIEKTNQSRAIKYLFKYISKGNDRVIAGIYNKNDQPASVRSTGGIILNVASSGIAATLLPSGRTAHSRNIDQAAGMCNGTRLQISQLGKNVIKAKALNGTIIGEEILIHRMDMNPSETKLPFNMTRRQRH